ncbi:alkaline phosphatase family protein [Actinomadura craniellae]|uniref:Alkaline phosphatase family protein n=1 Tax=Actinomadura craniellae TaxID=2231787 RepID=A0A365H479_9ACTN|nr:alkaline phosphatase D family protein [Actinomadura craniellae]RAY13910.1 alkaline phosphatase family protein [Actinomadura craniellae]
MTARLTLGPLLRYVDETSATIWVETDRPCEVEVLDTKTPTFTVHGHHYALCDVTGLEPGSRTPYQVRLDGEVVWPEPGSELPPSKIRTLRGGRRLELAFGSCRSSVGHTATDNRTHGVDMLRAYALRLAGDPEVAAAADQTREETGWPDLLLLLGDQVYADETSPAMREFIEARRDTGEPPGDEIADFDEYAELYRLAWSDPVNRWLLSTVPALMIFDDHDIRDDWNTSRPWRDKMNTKPWWRRRITSGLGAYWIYQHLGNLSPAERADEPLLRALLKHEGDGGALVDEFARRADRHPESYRWSYARELGDTRLIMVDSRCSRVLDPGGRAVLDADEWRWFDERMRGDVDHLLIGTSLPYLLTPGLHDLEAWNEAVCDGAWGGLAARAAEAIRQAVDLEHWAAFQNSFTAMAGLVRAVARGERGRAPETIVFLSGDVHYSYLAPAHVPGQNGGSRIYQAVCSPVRNPLPRAVRLLNGAASFGLAKAIGGGLARLAGVRRPPLRWKVKHGPWFPNALATLKIDGMWSAVRWEAATGAVVRDGAPPRIKQITEIELAGPVRAQAG